MSDRKKIKVLRIINRFNIGGPTYNATFLTKFLSDDFETLLIGGLPEKNEANSLHILEKYGVEPLLLPEMKREPNLQSDRIALKKIKSIIHEFQPDIVHTHASKAGALGRKAALSCKVPIIVHTFHGHVFHSYFGKLKTFIFKNIERYLAKKLLESLPFQIFKKELCEIHKIAPKDKTKVIPLGFDLEIFQKDYEKNRILIRNKYEIDESTVAIAIVGRITAIKDHYYFLDVIESVFKSSNKKIKIFIVGDGDLKAEIEKRLVPMQNIGIDISLTSWIYDIAEFNAGMDIMCLTSKNEGTPVSLIEAQASNLPVVSTEVGGVADIVKQNETGFIIPRTNKSEFVTKLKLLIENDELREKMKLKGWQNVYKKYSYQRLAKDVENYYRELLKN